MDTPLFSAYRYVEGKMDWRQAIALACEPLIQQEKVTASYPDAIIQATEQHGPWYILSPEFALPHARPEEGVLSPQSCLSLLCTHERIAFPGYPDVRLIIVLAAADSQQHLLMIQQLVNWLDDGDRLRQLSHFDNQEAFAAQMVSLHVR